MRIVKCDACNADLEKQKYYEIGDIEFHVPESFALRVHTSSDEIESYDNTQSWVTYRNLHFCELCWEKESFKNYLPKLS